MHIMVLYATVQIILQESWWSLHHKYASSFGFTITSDRLSSFLNPKQQAASVTSQAFTVS